MGMHNTKMPDPKLTFRKFNYDTEMLQTEIARQEKLRSILSKGEVLAGKLSGNLGYVLKAINFLISQNSLESALVDSKINQAVVNNTVWALKCKMRAIESSVIILQGNITDAERIAEIRQAEYSCREILNMFCVDGCLKDNALDSSAFLFPFSTIYVEVIKAYWLTAPSPDIKTHIKTAASELLTTLKNYKCSAVKSRMDKILERYVEIHLGTTYYAVDKYREDFKECSCDSPNIRNLYDRFHNYKNATERLYIEFYDQFIENCENSIRNM